MEHLMVWIKNYSAENEINIKYKLDHIIINTIFYELFCNGERNKFTYYKYFKL